MPWVIAKLRGQKVYARATPAGALDVSGGRVEIRYKPNDGRRYEARADNLTVDDATVLPEETCGAAERPEAAAKQGASGNGAAPGARPAGRAPAKSKAKGASSGQGSAAFEDEATLVASGAIVAYTDGACSGNPGPAGLGVVLLSEGRRAELSEYLGHGTNNVAELTAILRAVEDTPDSARPLVIHTDSQYAIGVLARGWKAKANAELIGDIRDALSQHGRTRLVYVPGHAGVPLNERADELAREAIQRRATTRR